MNKSKVLNVILATALLCTTLMACDGRQKNEREEKDKLSEEEGLDRVLTVYSQDGTKIKTYEGKFDIDSNSDINGGASGSKIKFDLNGKRHIIYNALVINDEK